MKTIKGEQLKPLKCQLKHAHNMHQRWKSNQEKHKKTPAIKQWTWNTASDNTNLLSLQN